MHMTKVNDDSRLPPRVFIPLEWEVRDNGAAGRPFPTLRHQPESLKELPHAEPAPTPLPHAEEKAPELPREPQAKRLKGGEDEC